MLAIQSGWASIVRYLVEQTDVALDTVDSGGFNATDIAAMYGYLGWEEKGGNSDVADIVNYYCEGNYQFTGVQMAVKYGRFSIARYLMVLGAVIPRDICQLQVPFESDMKGYS